jgi:S-DNA-T family DNA segregation ATPase FtsK/SpoIIIE
MGDFLYTMQGVNTPVRVQSAYLEPDEAQRVINYIKMNNEAYYDEDATAYINNARAGGGGDSFGGGDEVEPVYIDALRYVILSESASISMIQRKCGVGYPKAGKIVEWMEDMGYISSFDGARARKVLISREEFESKYGAL